MMLGRPAAAVSPQPIVPRPVHNERGSVFALARGLMQELDMSRENTSVRTASLELILRTFCDLAVNVSDMAAKQQTGTASIGLMVDAANRQAASNMQRAADRQHADNDGGAAPQHGWRPMTAVADEDDE